jgi:hypothetical protein
MKNIIIILSVLILLSFLPLFKQELVYATCLSKDGHKTVCYSRVSFWTHIQTVTE